MRVPVAAPTAPSTAPISAADDESPDPISTSLVIDIAPPGTGWPAPRSAQIAPAAAQPVTCPGVVSSGIRAEPSARSLRAVIAPVCSG